MTFRAILSTADGRLTRDRVYYGNLVYNSSKTRGLRVAVFDNKGEWMTFDPAVFAPVSSEYHHV